MKSHLIFIGAPGSGKGTQASKFVADLGYRHVSTGDLLRSEITKQTDLGREVKLIMDSGELVSDDLVIRLLKANINVTENLYIFDGYPRNIAQVETLDREVLIGCSSVAVYFEINFTKLIARLTNRRTCKNCGAIYNLLSKQPKIIGVCDQCGSTDLIQRADDKEEVIRNRLDVFQQTISPVLKYYQDQGRLLKVDAEGTVEGIFKEISSKT